MPSPLLATSCTWAVRSCELFWPVKCEQKFLSVWLCRDSDNPFPDYLFLPLLLELKYQAWSTKWYSLKMVAFPKHLSEKETFVVSRLWDLENNLVPKNTCSVLWEYRIINCSSERLKTCWLSLCTFSFEMLNRLHPGLSAFQSLRGGRSVSRLYARLQTL